jgi:hypothetical protein
MAGSAAEVTDPDVIAALEAQAQGPQVAPPVVQASGVVTDPDLIAKLESQSKKGKSSSFFPDSWDDAVDSLKHQAGMAGRIIVNTVTGLPMMAADAGVAARNLYSGATGGSYNEYPLPSQAINDAEDRYFGKPQNAIEKGTQIVGPMLGGAAASKMPGTLAQAVAGAPGPSGDAAQVPSNFVTPAQAQAQRLAARLKDFQDKGFVTPPSTTNPTFINNRLEGLVGKQAVEQNFGVADQQAANRIAAKANGLNPDGGLTEGALQQVIKDAGKNYNIIDKAGRFGTDDEYLNKIAAIQDEAMAPARSFPGTAPSPIVAEADTLTQPFFDAKDARLKIRDLRDKASVAFRQGDGTLGNQYKQLSGALEDQLDRGAQATADPSVVARYRAARQQIAIAKDTLDNMNSGSEGIDIGGVAKALDRGDIPPNSPLADIGRFGAEFKRLAVAPEKRGSPGVHALGSAGSLMSGIYAGTEVGKHYGPVAGTLAGLGTGFAYPAAQEVARRYLMSPAGQARAIPKLATETSGPMSTRAQILARGLADFNQ